MKASCTQVMGELSPHVLWVILPRAMLWLALFNFLRIQKRWLCGMAGALGE